MFHLVNVLVYTVCFVSCCYSDCMLPVIWKTSIKSGVFLKKSMDPVELEASNSLGTSLWCSSACLPSYLQIGLRGSKLSPPKEMPLVPESYAHIWKIICAVILHYCVILWSSSIFGSFTQPPFPKSSRKKKGWGRRFHSVLLFMSKDNTTSNELENSRGMASFTKAWFMLAWGKIWTFAQEKKNY